MSVILNHKELPSANKRPVIVVISQQDYNKSIRNYETSKDLFKDGVYYLVEPTKKDISSNPILAKMDEQNQLIPGTVLVQDYENPDLYLPFDEGIKKNIFSQMNMFNSLCQALGAKRVKFNLSEKNNNNVENKANLGITLMPNIDKISVFLEDYLSKKGKNINKIENEDSNNNGRIGFNKNLIQEIKKELGSDTEFEGGNADLKRAQDIVNSKIFDGNAQIIAFYNAANTQFNRMKNQTCSFTLIEKTKKSLGVFVEANLPILLENPGGDINFNRIKESIVTLQVEYTVSFE